MAEEKGITEVQTEEAGIVDIEVLEEETAETSASAMVAKKLSGEKSIYELLEEDIKAADMPEAEKTERLSKLLALRSKKANIILVGATGSGKSSTINALFNMEVAKVGVGVDPETDAIRGYELDNLIIWDTPGLGDGKADPEYNDMIMRKLCELGEDGKPVIDLVLVVLDASSKDLGTSYDLINDVVIPCMGPENCSRILICLNQADMAMKGKHWNAEANEPDEVLLAFLREKASSVQKRIFEMTGVRTRPIYYCAGYKEEGAEQCRPYNLTKLLYYIVKSIPSDKRLALADNINPDRDKWLHDDKEADYRKETKKKFFETIGDYFWEGIYDGGEIGQKALGVSGKVIGGILGGAFGGVKGFFKALFR